MTNDELEFCTFCVGTVACATGRSEKETYNRLKSTNIIDGYIVPCYDVLHTFGRQYIADDLVELLEKRDSPVPKRQPCDEEKLPRQIILQMKYARVIALIAEKRHISNEEAMDKFYNSETFDEMSSQQTHLFWMSDAYIADEACLEFDGKR